MSLLFRHRKSSAHQAAERLHDDLVAATRRPVFYLRFGVPDTFEGRFDLLVLHVALALRRLGAQGDRGAPVAQHLVDTMFARLDIALREIGVSDIGVPKRMKRLAEAFKGRTSAYVAALDAGDDGALAEAVRRNVLSGAGEGRDLAHYARRVDGMLAACDLAASDALPAFPEPCDAA